MLIDKKGYRKIILFIGLYLTTGCILVFPSLLWAMLGAEYEIPYLGIAVLLCCPLIWIVGRYYVGVVRVLGDGARMLRIDLRPREFIEYYESLENSPELVLNKPTVNVLTLLSLAYDLVGDREGCLAVTERIISVAGEKKKGFAKLVRASYLFSYGRVEEGELLYNEALSEAKDAASRSLADTVMKTDRAMAMGDYKTVEAYNLEVLGRSFPKADALSRLVLNSNLGEIYEKSGEPEKALLHYTYCAENGGETAIRDSAREAVKRLTAESID